MSVQENPSMEGFLEKHSTGVSRLLGRTRFWSTLRGSCLVYCKESKRSSMVETLLLGDAQMVRKTSNDRQGVQFEIVMKKQKTYVFSAASSDECSSWVRHLQQAMIRNEPGARMSGIDFRQRPSDSGYEEITLDSSSNPSFSNERSNIIVPQSGIYADVADAITAKSGEFPIPTFTNSSVGEYAEVADVIRPKNTSDTPSSDEVTKRESSQSDETEVVYRENSLYVANKDREKLQQQLQRQQDSEDIGGGYQTLDSLHDVEATIAASTLAQEAPVEEMKEPGSGIPIYATVNKQRTSKPPEPEEDDIYVNIEEDRREGAAIERLDNELKRLPVSSAPPVWESTTADDRKPLDDLKEFLANNRHLCRSSYVRQTSEGDPILKIKEIILSAS